MRKIRTVIIGMGRMGKTRYSGLKAHGGFEIIGVCDKNAGNLIGYSERTFTEWRTCIDETNPEAVVVCTYNVMIPDVTCYALEKGISVFAEKPPGRNYKDALKMKESLDKKPGTVLKFGFNHRYHNSVIEAKALIDSGLIGDIVCARGVYGKAGSLNFANEWRNDMDISGGGILLDQGIHMVDLLCYFIGKFTKVKSSVGTLFWKDIPTEDSAFAILENEIGQIASLHSSALQWRHKFDLDIICTNGYIALNGLLTSTNSYGEESMTYYKKDILAKNSVLGTPTEHTLYFDSDYSWAYEHKEFYDAITNNSQIKHGTIKDALDVMRIIERIYEIDKK